MHHLKIAWFEPIILKTPEIRLIWQDQMARHCVQRSSVWQLDLRGLILFITWDNATGKEEPFWSPAALVDRNTSSQILLCLQTLPINDPFLSRLALWLTALCWVVNPEVRPQWASNGPGFIRPLVHLTSVCHCVTARFVSPPGHCKLCKRVLIEFQSG